MLVPNRTHIKVHTNPHTQVMQLSSTYACLCIDICTTMSYLHIHVSNVLSLYRYMSQYPTCTEIFASKCPACADMCQTVLSLHIYASNCPVSTQICVKVSPVYEHEIPCLYTDIDVKVPCLYTDTCIKVSCLYTDTCVKVSCLYTDMHSCNPFLTYRSANL